MTKAEAKRLCLIKWGHAKETGCDRDELDEWCAHHPELGKLNAFCGYCQKYVGKCMRCPLFKLWKTACSERCSPWCRWAHENNLVFDNDRREKLAIQIYEDIERS